MDWVVDVGVGAVVGYLLITFTIGLFVEGAAFGALLVLGMILGVTAMRFVRRTHQEP